MHVPVATTEVTDLLDEKWSRICLLWVRLRSRFESLAALFKEELGRDFTLLHTQFQVTQSIVQARSLPTQFFVDIIEGGVYFLDRLEVFAKLFDKDAERWGSAKVTFVNATAVLRSDLSKFA